MSVFNNAFSSVWKPTFGSVWDVPSSPLIEITLGPEYSWFPYKVYYNSETNEFESSYNFDTAKPTGGTTYYQLTLDRTLMMVFLLQQDLPL